MPVSHEEILSELREIAHQLGEHIRESAQFRGETMTRTDQLAGAIRVVAEQNERMEDRILAYDKLKDRIMGGLGSATFMIIVVWWLVKDKIEAFFGVKK